jgi:hypothetical protein
MNTLTTLMLNLTLTVLVSAETVGTINVRAPLTVACDVNTTPPREPNAGLLAFRGDPRMKPYFQGGCVLIGPDQMVVVRFKSDTDFGYLCVTYVGDSGDRCYLIPRSIYYGPEPRTWGPSEVIDCPVCLTGRMTVNRAPCLGTGTDEHQS